MQTLTVVFTCVLALGASAVSQTSSPGAASKPAAPRKSASSAPRKSATATTAKKSAATASKPAGSALALDTEEKKHSYAMGMNLGNNLKKQGVEVNYDALSKGLEDALKGNQPLMTQDEADEVLTGLQNQLREKAMERMKEVADKNKAEGDKFLAENKTKPGVVTLPDGLQYKVITEGTGPRPTADDTVVVNYRGSLINGQEFDSSYKRNEPLTIPVGRVIKGWTEALQLMPVGSKWQVFIPGDLGYGERGAGGDIPPNSTLIFDVELLSIKAKEQPKEAPPAEKAEPQK